MVGGHPLSTGLIQVTLTSQSTVSVSLFLIVGGKDVSVQVLKRQYNNISFDTSCALITGNLMKCVLFEERFIWILVIIVLNDRSVLIIYPMIVSVWRGSKCDNYTQSTCSKSTPTHNKDKVRI